ncbi:MAG: LysR family transcriptional regulator [Erythrobacter sp.]
MLPLDIPLLHTFLDLAETGNFTRTAARVHRTQSAVSAQIRRLEEMLGEPLFERTTRAVALTPAGERLIPHAREVVAAANALAARFHGAEVEGDVRIGCPEDVASADLPAILADFAATHPRVRLHVRCDLTLHLAEQFEAGAFDLIFIKQDPARILAGAQLLRLEPLAWVCAPHLRDGAPRAAVPLVLAPAPCVYRARALEALERAGYGADVVYASPSEAGQIAAVRAGLGWTVLPERRVPPDLAITGAGWPALRKVAICLLSVSRKTGAIEAFAAHAEARLGEPDETDGAA